MSDPQRRCGDGPFYLALFIGGAMLLALGGAVVIWWALQCP